MAARWRLLLLLAALWTGGVKLWAGSEEDAFRVAEKEFEDGFYKKAESDFGDFAEKFPASKRLAEARLFQANARFKSQDFTGALTLLSAHQAQAGKLGDQYLLLQAEATFQKGEFQ